MPVLDSKKDSTKFRILVEIAANQPNVRQHEIAGRLNITPQAVSEYIKEWTAEDFMYSDGRVHYKISTKGIEWVLNNAKELKHYLRYVTEDVISNISIWTAIAEEDLDENTIIVLHMCDGLLYAKKCSTLGEKLPTGRAMQSVAKGADVGITDFKGTIDVKDTKIVIAKVPRINRGGSHAVNLDALKNLATPATFTAALGVEALVSLRKIGIEPDVFFGAKSAVIEAAFHGISPFLVSIDEELPSLLEQLGTEGLSYELYDITQ